MKHVAVGQVWLEVDLSEAMRPGGRSAKLGQGWSPWFYALNKQAALSFLLKVQWLHSKLLANFLTGQCFKRFGLVILKSS